ncbi:oxidoreductase [Gephyromycinifex aptenodytis]|uniref:oxidoreductase n=1 Tax=Gephyromycinifex aptenodytis TaxID=2716227 RepID=UPI0014458F18|nr:oxidoreductase [Gephyromycinifex aptenodytis]
MSPWSAIDIPDQTGRVFVVTGATSGLGLVTARELARAGGYVVLACRNIEKGEQVRQSIPGGDDHSEVRHLDLADLDSVHAFADGVSHWRIETLINNAGLMAIPLQRTAQGFEMQFGVNVLGHFLLTSLLLPRLTDRVVWLSSLMHRPGHIDLDDLNWEQRRYDRWKAYSQSKLADLMLAYELQRRLVACGSQLRSIAAHPGYSATELQTRSQTPMDAVFGLLNKFPRIVQPAEQGALPSLFAATVADLPGGSFIGPDGPMETRGFPRPVGSTAASHDRDVAASLWSRCEDLTDSGSWPL